MGLFLNFWDILGFLSVFKVTVIFLNWVFLEVWVKNDFKWFLVIWKLFLAKLMSESFGKLWSHLFLKLNFVISFWRVVYLNLKLILLFVAIDIGTDLRGFLIAFW